MAQERVFACHTAEVPSNAAKIVKIKSRSVGVFRVGASYHALLNVCPHRGGALCEGPICGTTGVTDGRDFVYEREGEIVRCAWHGWEFDIRTGVALVDRTMRARTLPVEVEHDAVYVTV